MLAGQSITALLFMQTILPVSPLHHQEKVLICFCSCRIQHVDLARISTRIASVCKCCLASGRSREMFLKRVLVMSKQKIINLKHSRCRHLPQAHTHHPWSWKGQSSTGILLLLVSHKQERAIYKVLLQDYLRVSQIAKVLTLQAI